MDRRTFLSWVGVGTLASSLPVAIVACTSSETSNSEASPETSDTTASAPAKANPEGFVEVGKLSELKDTGFVKQKDFEGAPLLVILDPKDQTKAVAFKNQCTHNGCAVDWKAKEGVLVCPCHGSKYKPDGTVANGPATGSLPTYTAKIEGEAVLVKAS
ncbi:MAG: ubiquinol-cytochrome c reductase iron-sulfur subunit [Acaryochloridaceae cyanobacterium CSU_3_4]|nr:ubiquinol-cytochrome c reductase iron-sulfur subunit [Acaryochloridaceae cyanobacterium CSU_3_4]